MQKVTIISQHIGVTRSAQIIRDVVKGRNVAFVQDYKGEKDVKDCLDVAEVIVIDGVKRSNSPAVTSLINSGSLLVRKPYTVTSEWVDRPELIIVPSDPILFGDCFGTGPFIEYIKE